MTTPPLRIRPFPPSALSAGWEPTPHHQTVSLTRRQLARIRSGYDGTMASIRRLASELGLPLYIVRESALALGRRNTRQPRRTYPRKPGSYHPNAGADERLEVAS